MTRLCGVLFFLVVLAVLLCPTPARAQVQGAGGPHDLLEQPRLPKEVEIREGTIGLPPGVRPKPIRPHQPEGVVDPRTGPVERPLPFGERVFADSSMRGGGGFFQGLAAEPGTDFVGRRMVRSVIRRLG